MERSAASTDSSVVEYSSASSVSASMRTLEVARASCR